MFSSQKIYNFLEGLVGFGKSPLAEIKSRPSAELTSGPQPGEIFSENGKIGHFLKVGRKPLEWSQMTFVD